MVSSGGGPLTLRSVKVRYFNEASDANKFKAEAVGLHNGMLVIAPQL